MKNISLMNRLRLIALVIILLFASFILAYLLPRQGSQIEAQVETKLENLVQTQLGTLEYYYKAYEEGLMSEEDAQAQALRTLETVRYNESDYFWVNDASAMVIMHPTNPGLNGTDQSTLADANGVKIFSEFARIGADGGSGFVRYEWPKVKDGEPLPKLSYVKGFKPWNYVVGTGIWIDDLNIIKNETRNLALLILAGVILVAVLLTYWVQHITKQSLDAITKRSEAYENYDYTQLIEVETRDELGKIATAFNHTITNLKVLIAQLVTFNQQIEKNSGTLTQLTDGLSDSAAQTEESSTHMAHVISETDQATRSMADKIQEVRDAVESIAERATEGAMTTKTVAERANDIQEDALKASTNANTLYERVKTQLEEAIDDSKRVNNIIGLADNIIDITEQTNLLALNASIEAARAGEAGRGFSVVADEISKLAAQSSETADSIQSIVKVIIGSVDKLAGFSESLLEFIDVQVLPDYRKLQETGVKYREDAEVFNDIMMNLSAASEELNASMDAILETIQELSESAENGARGVEVISDMNQELSQDATKVKAINDSMIEMIEELKGVLGKIKC